jgi:hypothetical protein
MLITFEDSQAALGVAALFFLFFYLRLNLRLAFFFTDSFTPTP